jgi:uncharacterized membrane protein YeaQ/YmgE (transglycosylase-associated protein family)
MILALLAESYSVWLESHGFVSWILLGLLAGWFAGTAWTRLWLHHRHYSRQSLSVGRLGLYQTRNSGVASFLAAAATLGAVILVAIAHIRRAQTLSRLPFQSFLLRIAAHRRGHGTVILFFCTHWS